MFPSYHPHGAEQAPRLTRVAVLASLSAPLLYGHTPHRAGRSSRRRLETPRCSVLTVAALATAQAQLALSMERSEHLKLQRRVFCLAGLKAFLTGWVNVLTFVLLGLGVGGPAVLAVGAVLWLSSMLYGGQPGLASIMAARSRIGDNRRAASRKAAFSSL